MAYHAILSHNEVIKNKVIESERRKKLIRDLKDGRFA